MATSLRSDSASLWAVFSATLGVGLIFGFQPPLLAFVLTRHGASSFAIGTVTSVGTIAVIMLSPFYPRLIARFGPRLAILVGIGIAVASLLVMPFMTGVQGWMALRLATGCALGLAWIASEVWLNMLSGDQSRSTVMGIYTTAFAAGVMSGPLLLQLTGSAGSRPFYVGALCLASTALPLLFSRPTSRIERTLLRKRPLGQLLRVAPIAMLAALTAGLVESTDISLLPVFGLRHGLDEPSALALVTVFLVGNVLLQLPISSLADRFGRRRVLAFCGGTSVIGPLLLSSALSTPWLLWPLLLLWGGTMYGFYAQGIALLGDSYPTEDLAAANSVFVVVYCLGGLVGPGLGGLAMDWWTPQGLVVFLSCVPLLLVLPLLARI
ncbi:MAG TPA: MFS transporter [Steroidobacteraceae bacterium]|nr:MFS transporter [Steroidobacteraceae bacterium]